MENYYATLFIDYDALLNYKYYCDFKTNAKCPYKVI
jgi:hypothetical protein